MGSEYFINSQELEDKVRDLLPSQGGAGAGFDLSASTQIIPIIDLTESAEGSNIRQDLQTSFSFGTITAFDVNNTTSTLINNTGYYRVYGTSMILDFAGGTSNSSIQINDGASNKIIYKNQTIDVGLNGIQYQKFDFNVFLSAGDSLTATASVYNRLAGATRQIADITGTLTNP